MNVFNINLIDGDEGKRIELYSSIDGDIDEIISVSGGAGGPYTFTFTFPEGSTIPDGLTFDSDGTITGSADEGVYGPVSMVITDGGGNSITIEDLLVYVY